MSPSVPTEQRARFLERAQLIAERARARRASELELETPGLRLAVVHRLGRLAVGEASIAIVAASPRRDAALAAVRTALERVKSEAPIWKREIYADGSERWREEESLNAGSGL